MKKIFFGLILTLIFLTASRAYAATGPVTQTDGDFVLTYDSPLFDFTNAAPGQTYASDFSVTNTGQAAQDLQFQLNVDTPETLADFLFLKIEDGNSNCLWGCDGSESISQINGAQMTFSGIPAGQIRNYKFVLLFSPDAGNDLQNASMNFDMTLGYVGSVPSGNNNNSGSSDNNGGGSSSHHSNNNHHTHINIGRPGQPLIGIHGAVAGINTATADGPTLQNQVAGVSTSQPGKIDGVSVSICHGWPKWIWEILLVVYLLVLLENLRRNYAKAEVGWKLALAWTVAALAFWYFFDHCRSFSWFASGVVILAIASYFLYLSKLKKKIEKNTPADISIEEEI